MSVILVMGFQRYAITQIVMRKYIVVYLICVAILLTGRASMVADYIFVQIIYS